MEIETHPFYSYVNYGNDIKGGFVPLSAQTIIMGTFPPKDEYIKKGDGFFFYSSALNHLWNRIDNIYKNDKDHHPLKQTKTKNAEESFLANKLRKQNFQKAKVLLLWTFFQKYPEKQKGRPKTWI